VAATATATKKGKLACLTHLRAVEGISSASSLKKNSWNKKMNYSMKTSFLSSKIF